MVDTVSESGEKTAQTLVGGLLSSIHRVTPQNYTELYVEIAYSSSKVVCMNECVLYYRVASQAQHSFFMHLL